MLHLILSSSLIFSAFSYTSTVKDFANRIRGGDLSSVKYTRFEWSFVCFLHSFRVCFQMLTYSKTADLGGFILPRDLATAQKATVDTISEPFNAKDLIPTETKGKKNEDGENDGLVPVQYDCKCPYHFNNSIWP